MLSMKGFEPEAMALVVPRVFVEEFGVLPLRVAGQRILYLAFEDRLDASAALAVEQMTELKVESGLMDGAQFREARAMLLQCDYRGGEYRGCHEHSFSGCADRVNSGAAATSGGSPGPAASILLAEDMA